MPQCHRCERVQASAEMRRTPLGHVCKGPAQGVPNEQCREIARELRAMRCPFCGEPRSAHVYASRASCVLAVAVVAA